MQDDSVEPSSSMEEAPCEAPTVRSGCTPPLKRGNYDPQAIVTCPAGVVVAPGGRRFLTKPQQGREQAAGVFSGSSSTASGSRSSAASVLPPVAPPPNHGRRYSGRSSPWSSGGSTASFTGRRESHDEKAAKSPGGTTHRAVKVPRYSPKDLDEDTSADAETDAELGSDERPSDGSSKRESGVQNNARYTVRSPIIIAETVKEIVVDDPADSKVSASVNTLATTATTFQDIKGLSPLLEDIHYSSSSESEESRQESKGRFDVKRKFCGVIKEFLKVEMPESCKEFGGIYRLVPGKFPNGYPLWTQNDGEHYIFAGLDDLVLFGDEQQAKNNFACAEGIIASVQAHEGKMPHQVKAWQMDDDDSGWVEDQAIVVKALSPADRPTTATKSQPISMESSGTSSSSGDENEGVDAFDPNSKLGQGYAGRMATSRQLLQSSARVKTMMYLPNSKGEIVLPPDKRVSTWS